MGGTRLRGRAGGRSLNRVVRRLALVLALGVVMSAAASARAVSPGSLDAGFGVGGKVTSDFGGPDQAYLGVLGLDSCVLLDDSAPLMPNGIADSPPCPDAIACQRLHSALATLPLLHAPSENRVQDGLYFFYEHGEESTHGPVGRIVRVGNHPRSDGSLGRRLRQHYSGRKNGSAFRRLLGGALIRVREPSSPCLAPGPGRGHWERQGDPVCGLCAPMESQVSRVLQEHFAFRCVSIPQRAERNRLEAAIIGTLARCGICRPSSGWLGLAAYSDAVRGAGLWNSQFVDAPGLTEVDLAILVERVVATESQSQ